ncbi:hypothetical protein [Actinoplanes sp. NPDC051851]|uniref:hypothetical protein n=1 Tax=Actinoplanes sp. NPDC051851 TaxID=3154753 RepID=UPI0034404371
MLTVLVLLPTAALFLRVLEENSNQRDDIKLEQQGVEYLTALSPLISALAESQSSALQGVAAEPASLTAAVSRVQGVDERLGDTLGTKQRWSDLAAKIAKLPKVTGDSNTIFTEHVEVADLTLALYEAVRQSSGLNRDPDADIWFLQQTAAVEMPETVTMVSQMGDLANMLAAAKKSQQAALRIKFGTAVQLVTESVNELTDNLQEAVDDTSSSTLSGNLVSNLDSFRRGVEAANRGANPGGNPDVSTLVTAQSTLQTALNALSGVTLKEISGLLDDRSDTLTYRQFEAYALFGVAVILVFLATVWSRGRGRQTGGPGATSNDPSREVSVQADRAAAQPSGGGTYGQPSSAYGDIPNYGDGANGRERSGALR